MPLEASGSWNLPYLNFVVAGTSSLSLFLLATLKSFEKELETNFNPPRMTLRVIDLEVLACSDQVLSEDGVILPHPEFMNRPFLGSLMASLRSFWRYSVSGLPYSYLTLADSLYDHIRFNREANKCFFCYFLSIYNGANQPLPAAYPELNPCEQVCKHLRRTRLSNRTFKDEEELLEVCSDAWNELTSCLSIHTFQSRFPTRVATTTRKNLMI